MLTTVDHHYVGLVDNDIGGYSSPFKRQMSLRISELPSNLERQRAGLGSPPRASPPAAAPAGPDLTAVEVSIKYS